MQVLAPVCGDAPVPLRTKEHLRQLLLKLGGLAFEGWESDVQEYLADDRLGTGLHLLGLANPEVRFLSSAECSLRGCFDDRLALPCTMCRRDNKSRLWNWTLAVFPSKPRHVAYINQCG